MADVKQRHGCLTAWLALMVLANAGAGLLYLLRNADIPGAPPTPGWAHALLVVLSFANVAFAVGLWLWKKWGFFGFAATSGIAFVVNLVIGVGIVPAMVGLLGFAILYWVLQMGGDKKAWTRLE